MLGQRSVPAPPAYPRLKDARGGHLRASRERDLAGSHSVESLARGSYVSGGYLIALFRKRFGMGPMRYVQQRRIKLAQRLLADPYLTVRQVGQLCGYEDPNYFSRTFRKVSGVSPREYRNSE